MTNLHDNLWIPSAGYKYISNGEIWTDSLYLGNGADISEWYDTNDEPPELGPDNETDYAMAARILLGVSE